MKALCWYGTNDVRVETVPDPKFLNSRDAIVRITATAICGSVVPEGRLRFTRRAEFQPSLRDKACSVKQ
jgi:threonine dehydrogenase-like Zn-dependent dehydrogenase